jgi:transcription antitermination factor NusG
VTEQCKWYVITTRPRAEKKISLGLTKIGVEHFLPLQKQLRQWKDRKKWVETPLFNSYIFIYIAEQFRSHVFEVPGVVNYLSVGGKASIIRDEEIDRIAKICRYENDIEIDNEILNIGDEVEVVEGPLKGIKGKLVEKANNTFLCIVIENLGYTASFKIDKRVVRKIGV